MNYEIDHVGIAVSNMDEALLSYKKSFGFELLLRENVPSQNVEVAFLKMPHAKIELLVPTNDSSSLKKFIDSRGLGFHHICYKVSDIKHELKRLSDLGYVLIDKEPRSGAHGSKIAFIHPKSCGGVLTELCEY